MADDFQEFFGPGERIGEGKEFSQYKGIHDVHRVGSLTRLTTTPQNINDQKRALLTLEGVERIRLKKELNETEIIDFFDQSKEGKIQELRERIENVIKLKANDQITDHSLDDLKV